MIRAISNTVGIMALYIIIYLAFLPPLSLGFISGYVYIITGLLLLVLIVEMWWTYIKEGIHIEVWKWVGEILLEDIIILLLSLIPTRSPLWSSLYAIIGISVVIIFIIKVKRSIEDFENFNTDSFIILMLLFFITVMLGGFISSSWFNSNKMYNQIGNIEQKSFTEDIVEIDNTQIPIVDIALADVIGDKKLGEQLALGSQAEVGQYTNKQAVNGELMYVAPLEHRGFFKWLNNQEGTPGFIKVSATNPNDVELVDEKIKFLDSAFFMDDLRRHIRLSGFLTQGLTEFSFELDDNGNPFWVITTYENTILWSTPEATGVIVCNPKNGECKEYSIEDAPEWIDIIQPEEFIRNQLENYGKFVHGPMNLSNKDELSVTEHITTVYNDGNCYYYTGLSSVGADNGTVGFALINTRTKEAKMYRMVGATETSAMSSAEGKVQNMHFSATTPIPLNISGIPTYFCTLKDDAGLVKQYAMINIEDYSIVEVGDTILETKKDYINSVNASGRKVDFSSELSDNEKVGTVTRISNNIENGNTYYYLILDNNMSSLYIASYLISEELPVTREGDKVQINYSDVAGKSINLTGFNNLNIAD